MAREVVRERKSRPVEEADFWWHAAKRVNVTRSNGVKVTLVYDG
jgi:hypothetical protein